MHLALFIHRILVPWYLASRRYHCTHITVNNFLIVHFVSWSKIGYSRYHRHTIPIAIAHFIGCGYLTTIYYVKLRFDATHLTHVYYVNSRFMMSLSLTSFHSHPEIFLLRKYFLSLMKICCARFSLRSQPFRWCHRNSFRFAPQITHTSTPFSLRSAISDCAAVAI